MRLLLIEDNEQLSQLLTNELEGAGFAVDVVTSVGEGQAVLASNHYAVVVLGLPDGDGLAVLRELRERGDPTPVLILTARDGVQDRVTGLRSGADDYLAKPFAFEELLARLQALLRRPGNMLGLALRFGNVTLDTVAKQVFIDDEPKAFSAREVAVLAILMRRSGRVMSKKLVVDSLFGLSIDIGSNAVEVYVHRLRKQLADAGANLQIHTIRGVGYLISAPTPALGDAHRRLAEPASRTADERERSFPTIGD
jgi:DNA-binding response OmpR family regulator